jgi:hypothetical protein
LLTLIGPYDVVDGVSFIPLVRATAGFETSIGSPCFNCRVSNAVFEYVYGAIQVASATETVIENVEVRYVLGGQDIFYTGTSLLGSYSLTLFHVTTDNPYPAAYGTVRAWATSTAYTAGQIVDVNGAIYQCSTSGTSASSGGGPSGLPSGSTPQSAFSNTITDGSAQWNFVALNNAGVWQDNYAYSLRMYTAALLDGYYGFVENNVAGTTGSEALFDMFDDLEVDHNYGSGVLLVGGEQTSIVNSWAGSSLQADGINVGASWQGQLAVSQTRIVGNWTNGVSVNGGVELKLIGNWIDSNSIGGSALYNGVTFAANVSRAVIQGNSIGVDPDIGSNNQGYGIFDSGTSDYLVISDNDLHGNVAGGLFNGASGTYNKVIDNIGYNPIGTTAAANVGASPATITAGNSPETHYIKQSASFNATVAKNGQTICGDTVAAVPCVVVLGPNESYVVTWTVTQPTYTKDVH